MFTVFIILGFLYIGVQADGYAKLSNQNTLLVRRTQEELRKYSINYGEKKIIFKYPHSSSTISIEMKHTDEFTQSVCKPNQRDIVFGDYEKGLQTQLLKYNEFNENDDPNFYDDPNYNDPSYFLDSPILLNMVHLPKGVAVVSSDHQLFLIKIQEDNTVNSGYKIRVQQTIDFGKLRESSKDFEVPQMVYCPSNDYIYLVYNTQVLGGKLSELLSEKSTVLKDIQVIGRNIHNPHEFIGTIKYARHHLFVPLGSLGIDMYETTENGDLQFKQNLKAFQIYGERNKQIYIIDLALGGHNAQHLYVLDRLNGIIVLEFGEDFQLTLNNKMGLIDIQGGLVIKEWNSTNLFVLVDGDITSQVQEFGINTKKNDWFIMRTHYLFGHYFDIEVTNKFAILRAVDAHRVIYHSIWEGFQMTYEENEEDNDQIELMSKLDEEYLILPALQQLDFYSENYGNGDPNTWHFNQTHKFIMGITSHSLIQIPYFVMHPIVECFTDDRLLIGQTLKYQLRVNTTDCKTKNAINLENYYTSMCEYIETMEVYVEYDGSLTVFTVEELFSIIIGLVMLLIILAIALAYCFSNYKKKESEISLEISGFESKGYTTDERVNKLNTQYP